jgi:hypothetical protein
MEKFKMPSDLWLKFGCFLTGYNYTLLSESSEASKKYIKKITSALIIIVSIWGMVGYMFASRYAGAGELMSIFGALMAGTIIVQIERQIILGGKVKKSTIIFRFLLGIIVAIIGALILDQVFFKNDIAHEKENLLNERINKRVLDVENNAQKTIALNSIKIDSLRNKIDANTQIAAKAGYKIQTGETQVVSEKKNLNSTNPPERITTNSKSFQSHPKLEENTELRRQVTNYELLNKSETDSLFSRRERAKANARNEPPGFLDELTIIVDLASKSGIALFAYLIFLSFFIFIELFIVLAKLNDGDNDYHRLIQYQELIREERLKILEQRRTASIGEDQRIDNSDMFINNRPR